MRHDWKFVVMLLVALAGILVPIGLWQFDLGAKSLTVRLVSSVALQAAETTSIPDLQVTIDGVEIASPYLSTIELMNDGAKPVPRNDFETPIEIGVGSGARIVRARISHSEPEGLVAELVTTPQSIKLKPLLLNPEDKVAITILTSGKLPAFIPHARIAGIYSIKFEDSATNESPWKAVIKNSAIAIFALILYFIFTVAVARPSAIRLTRILSICTMIACVILAGTAARRVYEAAEIERNFANMWPVFLIMLVIVVTVSLIFLRPSSRSSG